MENHLGGKCMICRFLLAALLLTGTAIAQAPPTVADPIAPAPTAPPSVEAFASLPFVERAELSPDGNHIAGILGVGGEQKIVLEATDFLSVTSSLANSADVIVSVLELT